MELLTNQSSSNMIIEEAEIIKESTSSFIGANTKEVSLQHLGNKCIIPVFSKDNETTISHFQFIDETLSVVKNLLPNEVVNEPKIRVSHIVKGRTPSALGKPAKELLENEKTIYYERCAFVIEIPTIKENVNNNGLTLSVGGVRAYNQENLYSKKSLEKFKLFIGFKNMVCTNLCVSTDGFSNAIRIGSILDLEQQIRQLFSSYNKEAHLGMMEKMSAFQLGESQFAHLIGKMRMYQHLSKIEQKQLIPITLNDSQINSVVKDYYTCSNFGRDEEGSINLWNLYNLFTEANKNSYIDSNLERNVNSYELINNLGNSLQNGTVNWLLQL